MPIVYGLGDQNGSGHTEDSDGNVQVDFVWGNLPMQPNDDRGMATLDDTLDNHVIAAEGWSNFPQFIPNYDGLVQYDNLNNTLNDDVQGDGSADPELEVVIPNFVRLTRDAASDLATGSGLQLYDFGHNLTVSYVDSTVATNGKTVRVTAYDTDYGDWSNQSDAALIGLRVGDELYFTGLEVDSVPTDLGTITVTKVNNDGNNSWFEFKTNTALELDAAATGSAWAGPNLENIVTVQRPNLTAAGKIANIDRNVNVRYISLD